jgi:hypothetical protein
MDCIMTPETKTLLPAESRIIRALLIDRYGPHSPFLDQLAAASVEDRRLTGVGIFVDLRLPETAAPVDQIDTEISDGYETTMEVPCDRVGFTLFIRNGYLSFLEGYTFGAAPWPHQELQDWLVVDLTANPAAK